MYSILEKNDPDQKRPDDIEPLYGPAILKKNRRFRDAVSWGCILLILLSFVAGLIVVSILLFNHGKSPELQTTEPHVSPAPNEESESVVKTTASVFDSRTLVKTACESFQGSREDGIFVFKGIPYAQQPVGKNRWKAPRARQPVECDVAAEIDATQFGPKCLQWDSSGKKIIGSEDCLYLNVWTPNPNSSANLDVMVFMHGGGTETEIGNLYGAGLLTGSGHEPGMMPTPELVKSSNMVFVSLNYRLGPFGFLAVNVKDPQTNEPIKGNFGLMDQYMALEWVKNNSQAFGGNPDKVTVFGVGAGASSILIHLASSKKPLFQKAWTASPSPHFNTTLKKAYRQNQEFLRNTPCRSGPNDAELHSCLYGMSPEEIFEAYPHNKWENRQFRDLPKENEIDNIRGLIIVDGEFLEKMPYEIWSKFGDHRSIPLLMGTTAQETDDWPLPADIHSWSWIDYEQYLFEHLSAFNGDLAAKVQKLYMKVGSPELQFTTLVSDMRENCPVSAVAQLLSYYWHEPVYRYVANFTKPLPQEDGDSPHTDNNVITYNDDVIVGGFHYSYHSIDMYHFFNKCTDSTEDQQFSDLLRQHVFEFTRTGRISGWNFYPNSTILLSSHLTPVSTYQSAQCELWRETAMFPKYAWMN